MKHYSRIAAFVLCLFMAIGLIPAAFADDRVLPGAEPLCDDTVLVGVSGTFTEDHAAVLRELNLIRYQACYCGDPDPRDRNRNLALADLSGGEDPSDAVLAQPNGDYVPAQWDSDLQRIAEIRAAEVSVSFSHTRPNNMNCFSLKINGTGSFCECIASTYDAICSLKMYRGERQTWIDGGSGETGHYTAMIAPSNLYYGIAGFLDASGSNGGSALEASFRPGGSTTPIERSGSYTQILELLPRFFDGAAITGEETMTVSKTYTLEMVLKQGDRRTFIPYEYVTWESSDDSVLCVHQGAVEAKSSGTATVSATFGGQTATLTVTVTEDTNQEDPEEPPAERSGQCGDNVFWKLSDDGVMTVYGEGKTWYYWENEPSFYDWIKEIREVDFEDGVTSIDGYFLHGMSNLETLRISKTVAYMSEGNWGLPHLATITVDPESRSLIAVDNVLYSKNMKSLLKYASQKPDVCFRVPDGVETVIEAAVCSDNLKTVILPESLRMLDEVAFNSKNLTDVYFLGRPTEDNGALKDVFGWWEDHEVTVHYPEWLKEYWAPNGETTWDIYPLVPYSSPVHTVALNEADVQFKGSTAYVVHNGKTQTPRVVVKDANGRTLDASEYTVAYRDNTAPGTAYADVRWIGGGPEKTVSFKIFLPATETTTVANVKDGIRLSWKAVANAKGYVIYRRAWSSTTNGWTTFERWNNTTATEWTDTKVYAGTRYQYGIKAYFDDPTDNYNLGLVGPLKTTVRITTRTLNSVTAGKKQMTVKWSGSKQCTGYQVKYATNPAFTKNVTAVKVMRPDAYQTVIKGLKSGTTYYVTVRSYTVFEGMTYFGEWSNALSCKIK